MKPLTIFLVCLFIVCFKVASAQPVTRELAPGYYVVVGAYADTKEAFAGRFTESLTKRGVEANYGFNTSRNLFFVYVHYFTSLKEALKKMESTRKEGQFVDAWVRVVPGDIKVTSDVSESGEKPKQDGNKNPPILNKESPPIDNKEKSNQKETSVGAADNSKNTRNSKDSVSTTTPVAQDDPMALGNTEVFLNLYNAANNRIVDGDVQVIDTDRSRQLMKVKGNEYLLLPDPKTESGKLTLICDVFGYRKIQNEINYPVPLSDTVKDFVDLLGTTLVVNFDLVRYHRGDITTLYNVYFYNDASVMQPESKYELNNLLQMMQENPNYKIKLHGHTNGHYHGKILVVGSDKNFFSLSGAKESNGSSMALSAARAEVIKGYLTSQGIDGSRIEVKAWGGKRPLYDKHSVNARKNVRVEVEILLE